MTEKPTPPPACPVPAPRNGNTLEMLVAVEKLAIHKGPEHDRIVAEAVAGQERRKEGKA